MKFEYFETLCDCNYSVGAYFDKNMVYIKNAAKSLYYLSKDSEHITLVCRGTSGCILAGAVGCILERKGKTVTIVVSRKSYNNHGENMSGIWSIPRDSTIVVIDDFVSTGETIDKIVKDLNNYFPHRGNNLILCVSNVWNEERLKKQILKEPISSIIVDAFATILCTKPRS